MVYLIPKNTKCGQSRVTIKHMMYVAHFSVWHSIGLGNLSKKFHIVFKIMFDDRKCVYIISHFYENETSFGDFLNRGHFPI